MVNFNKLFLRVTKHLFYCLLCVLCASCATETHQRFQEWLRPNGKIKVLCTIAMIEDLVKQVGGEFVDPLTLVSAGLDPHSYQMVKGDNEKLFFADVIFYNGLGLEHGASLKEYLTHSSKAFALGSRIQQEHPSLFLHYNNNMDRNSVDPHIWMDCSLWAKNIPYIVEVLAQQDPEHAAIFRSNGAELERKLLEQHKYFKELAQTIPDSKRFLITSHDAFNYFARAYLATEQEAVDGTWQKRFAAPEGLAPESQLSARDIQIIIDHMQQYRINVIFPESNVSQASIRKLQDVGDEVGLPIVIATDPLYGDAMGKPGSSGDSYLKMLRHNIDTMIHYLSQNGRTNMPKKGNQGPL